MHGFPTSLIVTAIASCGYSVQLGVGKEKRYRKITLLEAANILPACIVGVEEEKKLLEN